MRKSNVRVALREVLSACGTAARAGGEVRSAKVHRVAGPPLTARRAGAVRYAPRAARGGRRRTAEALGLSVAADPRLQ